MSLDVSNYVVVGNSFEAGYTDGSLFNSAIENSMPNMLAKQFAKAPGSLDTAQPIFFHGSVVFFFMPPCIWRGCGLTRSDVCQ
jgi:hypothetical protein